MDAPNFDAAREEFEEASEEFDAAIEEFEATHFSTNNVLHNKCNHKGNVCAQTMVELGTKYVDHQH
mgnify:CR=1 FL=1